jgi:hypothetical protein
MIFFFFDGIVIGTQGFPLAKQVLCHLTHTSSPICSGYLGDGGLMNYLSRLALNCDPPDLTLPSS